MEATVAQKLQVLRERSGLSIRKLAEASGVTAGMISCIERQKSSPSLTTLQKILTALGSDLSTFFSSNGLEQEQYRFFRERMRSVNDQERSYTIVFPKREDVRIEMFDEQMYPHKKHPEFEKLECTVAGYILSGQLTLEIKGEEKKLLRPGDAFNIPPGVEHRGYASTDEPVRVITVYTPEIY
jgi:transcriptional regulator with XRE-family HTH domain